MYIIVGLGNPEEKYAKTFHNMGFLSVGDAANILGVKFKKKECEAITAEANIGGEKVILAKPPDVYEQLGQGGKATARKV